MFIRSRYDILLGRPGTEVIERPKPSLGDEHLIIYGPRQSGRTQALFDDMVNYSRLGNKVCFFSDTQHQSDMASLRIPAGLYEHCFFFYTYNGNLQQDVRGLDFDGLYLDDFIQRPEDFSQRLDFFNAIMPLFCHDIRIVIASMTKEMPFDTTGALNNVFTERLWTFRELAPRP